MGYLGGILGYSSDIPSFHLMYKLSLYKLYTLHSWKLTWKPKRGPVKTTVPLNWGYMGFHVSLGECKLYGSKLTVAEGSELGG